MDLLQAQYSDLLDSLPYVDESVNDDATESQVKRLIQQEMRSFQPPQYLSKYSNVSTNLFHNHPLLQSEMDRIAKKIEQEERGFPADNSHRIDQTRYQLQPPPLNQKSDVQAWEKALNNAQAQLEHQYLRIENLELLQTYGANSWIQFNSFLDNTLKRLNTDLDETKKQLETVNLQRKNEQGACGTVIRNLESKRSELIHKNLQIEAACESLDEELRKLKKRKLEQNNS
mmetsp:Transcript_22522/g.31366  ORF Transcript_22522/g.31366 Transcript_22522/m.31366 type:complete len:229 (+) Transcript_22522:69-755(+)